MTPDSPPFHFRFKSMGGKHGSRRTREKHHEMRWPHLPVQCPPAATRSPPPLRRRCTLLSRPIPAGTGTKTASAHPKPPEQGRSERAHRPRAAARPPIRRDPRPHAARRGSSGRPATAGAGHGRRRRGSGTRDPGCGRRLGFCSGAKQSREGDAKLLRGFEMEVGGVGEWD